MSLHLSTSKYYIYIFVVLSRENLNKIDKLKRYQNLRTTYQQLIISIFSKKRGGQRLRIWLISCIIKMRNLIFFLLLLTCNVSVYCDVSALSAFITVKNVECVYQYVTWGYLFSGNFSIIPPRRTLRSFLHLFYPFVTINFTVNELDLHNSAIYNNVFMINLLGGSSILIITIVKVNNANADPRLWDR